MDKEYVLYTYKEILFSLKKEENLLCATRMNLEDIIRNEISQTQKDKYCMIPLIVEILNTQLLEQ